MLIFCFSGILFILATAIHGEWELCEARNTTIVSMLVASLLAFFGLLKIYAG